MSIEFYVGRQQDRGPRREVLDSGNRGESFFRNTVFALGSYSGPGVDLTRGYNLTAEDSGTFGMDFAEGESRASLDGLAPRLARLCRDRCRLRLTRRLQPPSPRPEGRAAGVLNTLPH